MNQLKEFSNLTVVCFLVCNLLSLKQLDAHCFSNLQYFNNIENPKLVSLIMEGELPFSYDFQQPLQLIALECDFINQLIKDKTISSLDALNRKIIQPQKVVDEYKELENYYQKHKTSRCLVM